MANTKNCSKCNTSNSVSRYFCKNCGSFLTTEAFSNPSVYELPEIKVMRILDNLKNTPHNPIVWDDMIDLYVKKVERLKALFMLPEMGADKNSALLDKMNAFLESCYKPEFQIAFVGTIKTGKSTLINALLGDNYASMSITPETAVLTKFRSNPKDYVRITFYTDAEWQKLWSSRSSGADAFMNEYNALHAEHKKAEWINHTPIYKELANSDIKNELSIWSSSKSAEHYFVKEIEVGISSLPKNFPKQVVFVDTPGLSDPVAYRSDITKQYIRKANAVFVCIDAKKLYKEEIETISSVFSFSSHNKNKVHIIATHWDKLNNPEEDWYEQKAHFLDKLVGKGFFDTREIANKNITYSSAYIYNLCRDYKRLEPNEKISILQFALSVHIKPQMINGAVSIDEETLPDLIRMTNIDYLLRLINTHLIRNYQTILLDDLKTKYSDINFSLKRIVCESKAEAAEFISISNADIEAMKQKVANHKKAYDEINKSRDLLLSTLNTVEKSTQQRLVNMLNYLSNTENSNETKKHSKTS